MCLSVSPMLNLPTLICIHTFTKELQCPQKLVKSQSQTSVRFVQTEQCRLSCTFASDAVLNITRKVLIDTEIRFLQKGLSFAPIQKKLNESKLRKDFKGFFAV